MVPVLVSRLVDNLLLLFRPDTKTPPGKSSILNSLLDVTRLDETSLDETSLVKSVRILHSPGRRLLIGE